MFSLVTALVSPCVVDCLAHKREALVAALQENASVICSHPADSVCLLQGEWENVKKAYAIVEEFYLRTQAESVVRRMLKVEPNEGGQQQQQLEYGTGTCGGGLVGGRIPPDQVLSLLLSPPPTDEADQSGIAKLSDGRRSPSKNCSTVRPCSPSRQPRLYPSAATMGFSNGLDAALDHGVSSLMHATVDMINRMGRSQEDSSPPVLSREGNIDDMSDISDTSEEDDVAYNGPTAMTFNQMPGPAVVSTAQNMLPSSYTLSAAPVVSSRDCLPARLPAVDNNIASTLPPTSGAMLASRLAPVGPPAVSSTAAATAAAVESEMDRMETVSSSRRLSSMSSDHSPIFNNNNEGYSRSVGGDVIEGNGGARLPQIASLFSNSALSAWPYAELYSAHLSAMRSICEATVKREASVDGTADFSDQRSTGYRPEDDPLAPEMRCSRCDKTYRSEARMREHARTHDAGYVAVLHACPKCGKAFTYRHNMVVHLRRFHYGWQPAKRHACRTCGMRFQKPYLLRLHERKAHMPVSQMEPGQLAAYGPT